jgi:hypothetical protein
LYPAAHIVRHGDLEELGCSRRRVGYQDSRVPPSIRIDSDHHLTIEVLGHVGHEAVLANNHDHVVRCEEEPIEV